MVQKNKSFKQDSYTIKAKKAGYPARSVYKLEEINKKYSLLNQGISILDLGASPGSWSIYCLRSLKNNCKITAVDLLPLDESISTKREYNRTISFIQGDFTELTTQEKIEHNGPYNLILCDAASATTGNRLVDTGRSFNLAWGVIELAENTLKQQGHLVVKIFQGCDQGELWHKMQNVFNKSIRFKPKACKKKSFEIYYIGLDKLEYKKNQ